MDPFDLDRWMASDPLTRRDVLRGAGRGAMGLSLAALLAACGSDEPKAVSSTLPPIAGQLKIAQWPLYIDRAKGGARPTLEAFTKETGIEVDYREIISDNQAWFAKVYPQLSEGQATGWDMFCIADWVVHQMDSQGFIEELHWDALPTADKNMLPAFRNPTYDPGNAHSTPWQGGVTGVAYYPDLVGDKMTRFADLWDEKLAGHVGMLTEMVDVMTLTLLSMGIDPQTATLDDAAKAQERLIQQRDAGIVRKYYGQDYIDALVSKDTWASMAWSGDVFYWKYLGGAPDLEFYVPEEGGIIWASGDVIPNLAEHPADAHAFMDFYFRPEIAVQVTDWVLYMTPVAGVQDLMRQKAKENTGKWKRYYETLSESPLLFPPEDPTQANLFEYKAFSNEEYTQYAELFSDVINV
jgi:spermidine/putrescine transport system substrate-binding protein